MGAGTVRSSSTILAASHGSRPRLTATKRDASQPCWALAVCPSHQNGPIRPPSGHGDRRLTSRARRSGRAGRLTAGLRGPRKKFSPSNSTPAYTLVALNRRSEQVEIFTFARNFQRPHRPGSLVKNFMSPDSAPGGVSHSPGPCLRPGSEKSCSHRPGGLLLLIDRAVFSENGQKTVSAPMKCMEILNF